MSDRVGRETVLAINSGSSSLKVALITIDGAAESTIASAEVDSLGSESGRFSMEAPGKRVDEVSRSTDHAHALELVLARLSESGCAPATSVGHRVVHGGARHVRPERITDALVDDLRDAIALAPLHLPPALAGIEAARKRLPDLPHVACFDTAFHANLPEVARCIAVPFASEELHRVGFHGLSYEYIVSALGEPSPERLVIAHLGNGASLAAVQSGRCVDTTMGLTPTGGIPMGTRTGDLDPGVLFYLARKHDLSIDDLEKLVNERSGLEAVGGDSDMKTLLSRRANDVAARLAVDVFTYAVRKTIGAYAAALGGLDTLVFTGGIGEHAPEIRAEACQGLSFLGIDIDSTRNEHPADIVSRDGAPVTVRVVPTHENLTMARLVTRLLRS